MKEPERPEGMRSRSFRWVTAVIGLLFLVLAVVILFAADSNRQLGAVLAAVTVGGLGGDALVSAVRNRRSILSRLGPLP